MRSKYYVAKPTVLSETNLKKLYKQLRVENIKLKQALELANAENVKKDKLIMELNTANMEIRGDEKLKGYAQGV